MTYPTTNNRDFPARDVDGKFLLALQTPAHKVEVHPAQLPKNGCFQGDLPSIPQMNTRVTANPVASALVYSHEIDATFEHIFGISQHRLLEKLPEMRRTKKLVFLAHLIVLWQSMKRTAKASCTRIYS